MTRCDEFATSATNVTANESNATQNEVAVMNGVAIIPIVRELLCKGEELGSLHLSLSVALARDVTSCGVLGVRRTGDKGAGRSYRRRTRGEPQFG